MVERAKQARAEEVARAIVEKPIVNPINQVNQVNPHVTSTEIAKSIVTLKFLQHAEATAASSSN